jgi:NADPH-dependent glutamate synthase beta subunit-like oxidoreductase
MEKSILDRRLNQMKAEGVDFQTQVDVGVDLSASYLSKRYDAIVLTTGASQPRDLNITGRGYENIVFAMDFLRVQNKIISGEIMDCPSGLNAAGKNVVVIGGGDTGSDCVGTARRQGAKSITQLEILPKPPDTRPPDTPWPTWPRMMRTSSSHEEGCRRIWSVLTKHFTGAEIRVSQVHCALVEWARKNGQWKFNEVPKSEFTLDADLVLLAMGFVHVEHGPLVQDLKLKLDDPGNIVTDNGQTSNPKVFAAGDAVSGASLVVRAINAGRNTADAVDRYLRTV